MYVDSFIWLFIEFLYRIMGVVSLSISFLFIRQYFALKYELWSIIFYDAFFNTFQKIKLYLIDSL